MEDLWEVNLLNDISILLFKFLLHLKGKQNSDKNTVLNNFQGKMLEKATGPPSETVKFHMMFRLSAYYQNGKLVEKAIQSS